MIRYQLNQWKPEAASYGPRGWLSFDGAATALNGGSSPNQYNAWAAFLLGLDQQVGKSIQNIKMTGREWQFGWYVRDRWQVSRRLTLNRRRRFGGLPACDREDPPPVRRRNPPIRFRDVETRALRSAHRLIA